MVLKKTKKAIAFALSLSMLAAVASPITASAKVNGKEGRTLPEKFGDDTYKNMFDSLYDDVVTNGTANGYLSKDGVPYHAVETVIVEAPDYGHETTSEAMSYLVWIAAMKDNLSGKSGELAKAWKTMEVMIPSEQSGFMKKTEPSATYSDEWELPEKYPTDMMSGNTGLNPIHKNFCSAYGSDNGLYLLHWLADVDDWYGFGGGSGKFTFINTFQRGEQESCFETIPQGCIEELKYGMEGRGIKGAFTTEDKVAEQYAYTNAPDAEERAIQGVYWANRWGVGDASVEKLAGKMTDELRNDMFDKYYKTIGCQDKQKDSDGGGTQGQHFLMSWYTAWGGAQNGDWQWQIGCSHAHQFYQNPLAAFGLLYDSKIHDGMKAEGATKDYEDSLTRQLEMYLWLSSAEGPFAGGCTNCWMGDYETYPSGIPQFYKMAYIEQPVYADPGSNNWTGNQYWATQRLAELYYLVCQDSEYSSKGTSITPGGVSIKEALKTVLDKWVEFFLSETTLDDKRDFKIPSSLKWSGAPNDWSGSYANNSGLHATVAPDAYQNTDLGCVCSYANTLTYYAAANGVKASEASASGSLAEKALYTAHELLDRTWENARDDIGLTRVDHNGSLARFWEQEVDTDGKTGKYPYGYSVGPGSTFIDIREMYKDPGQSYSDLYSKLETAYKKDKENGAKMVEFSGEYKYGMDCATDCSQFKEVAKVDLEYHRFWHAGDILMGLGTMAELYPEMQPRPLDGTDPDPKTETTTTEPGTVVGTDWGNVNESEGATPEARVNVSDAVLLARFNAEDSSAKVTTQGKKNADVNASGAPDKEDTVKILKFIAKLIPYESLGTTKDN